MRRWLAAAQRRLRGQRGGGERTQPACKVYAVGLSGLRGVPGSLLRLSPEGDYSQAMIDPAGTRVAFWGVHTASDGHQIWVSDLAGGNCRRVSREPGLHGHAFWWPDGRSLVCFSTAGVSNARDWDPARQFSPDRPARSLFRVDVASGERTRLTEGEWVDERPTVSADGRSVVFVSNRAGALNLWALDLATAELRQLTRGARLDYRPVFSPCAERIAYFTEGDDGVHRIALISWPEAQPLAFPQFQDFVWMHGPFWSPDGEHLLVHALRRGDPRPSLWMLDLHGQGSDRLELPGVRDCSHGSVDDRRRWLAFDSRESHGHAAGLDPAA